MNVIEKWIETDTAHRVPLHESKCKNIHGHRYRFICELTGDLYTAGPQSGMVLDFSFMKELMNEYIDGHIDHAIIISTQDEKLMAMSGVSLLPGPHTHHASSAEEVAHQVEQTGYWFGTTTFGKTYIINDYPTAENLAKHFFGILSPLFDQKTNGQAKLTAVKVHETPTSIAIYQNA